MRKRERTLLDYAKQQLRASILFNSRKPARLALEALDAIDEPPARSSAGQEGYCEFCPAGGGLCIKCGGGPPIKRKGRRRMFFTKGSGASELAHTYVLPDSADRPVPAGANVLIVDDEPDDAEPTRAEPARS